MPLLQEILSRNLVRQFFPYLILGMDTVCNYALLEFIDEHLICYAFIPVYVFYFGNGNNKIPGKSHESRWENQKHVPNINFMVALLHRRKNVSVSVDQIFVKKGDNESGKYTSKKCVLQLLLHLLQIRIRRGSRCLVRLFYYYTNIFCWIWNSFSRQIFCDVMPLSLSIKSWRQPKCFYVFAKLNLNTNVFFSCEE